MTTEDAALFRTVMELRANKMHGVVEAVRQLRGQKHSENGSNEMNPTLRPDLLERGSATRSDVICEGRVGISKSIPC